jgi:acyl-CoA thioesterase-1
MRMGVLMAALALGCQAGGDETQPGAGAPVAQSSETAPREATTGAPRVLIIGTSLTAGLGLDPDSAYPAVLQRKADSAGFLVRFEAAGLSGETSAGALRRAQWLLGEAPAMVVIETGANDGLRGLDPGTTVANLRAIVSLVRDRAPEAVVVIVQMEALPNLGPDYTRSFGALFGEVARETGSELMPFPLEGVAGVPTLNQDDGIHPTAAGARRVAQNAWGTLEPLLRRLGKKG